jgi:Photoprotection regulator fluorescence recovery protein
MKLSDIEWSKTEEKVAQSAFCKAYDREIKSLIGEVRAKAGNVMLVEDIWHLHDYLSAKRHDIDGKYDYDYPRLIFVFAQLVKEGWLSLNELDGLDKEKLSKVAALTYM